MSSVIPQQENLQEIQKEYKRLRLQNLLADLLFLLSSDPGTYFNILYSTALDELHNFLSDEEIKKIENHYNNPNDKINEYIDNICPPEILK